MEAIDHAIAAREAGADAILLMPPHHWLRFGRAAQAAVGFVHDVADAAGIDVILHQYPAWTKAGYSLDEMREIVGHPRVVAGNLAVELGQASAVLQAARSHLLAAQHDLIKALGLISPRSLATALQCHCAGDQPKPAGAA